MLFLIFLMENFMYSSLDYIIMNSHLYITQLQTLSTHGHFFYDMIKFTLYKKVTLFSDSNTGRNGLQYSEASVRKTFR